LCSAEMDSRRTGNLIAGSSSYWILWPPLSQASLFCMSPGSGYSGLECQRDILSIVHKAAMRVQSEQWFPNYPNDNCSVEKLHGLASHTIKPSHELCKPPSSNNRVPPYLKPVLTAVVNSSTYWELVLGVSYWLKNDINRSY
jgi:hypothetical protein